MSGASRYDPSLDVDSGDLSVPGSLGSPQYGTLLPARAPVRTHRRDISSPTPQRTYTPRGHTRAATSSPEESLNDLDHDSGSQAGPSRSNSARPPSPSPVPSLDKASIPARLGAPVNRSRSLNTHKKLPSLNTNTPSAKSPLSATDRLGYTRRPGDPRPPPLITPTVRGRMDRWVKEIVVCNFDLERGPVVERRIVGRRWGPGEKENVAFSSFPDTSLFAEGSIMFSFKIRHMPPDPSTLRLPEPPSPMPQQTESIEQTMAQTAISAGSPDESPLQPPQSGFVPAPLAAQNSGTGDKAEEYRKWNERGREWLYGYVWFEQRKDGGIARGYMQKSLVILTHLPFPSLFAGVLETIAPVFFEHGYSTLEAACHSIASWPDPVMGATLDLPLLSHVLSTKLPDATDAPQTSKTVARPHPDALPPILASLPHSTPLRAFSSFLPSLWSLWECLILAEPILIIAPDPRQCSEIVWWLRDLIRPIPAPGDFRPYLHIHDHDFSLLVNSNKPQAGVVVGVTNPFFRNAASHWPNVIVIPSHRPKRPSANSGTSAVGAKGALDGPEGFISRRHRSVSKDRPLLKRLEAAVAAGDLDNIEANEALRTHFQQLTERFLVPLNRYFQTLVPAPSLSAATASGGVTTTIKPFSLPAFLTHLRSTGPNPLAFKNKGLSMKSRVENDFYASFGMSPTFAGWLSGRIDSLGSAVLRARATSASTVGLFRSSQASLISASDAGSGSSVSGTGTGNGSAWRDSDETPRRDTLRPGDVFGPRRASET